VALVRVCLPVLLFAPASIIPPMLHTQLHLHAALSTSEACEIKEKTASPEIGELYVEKYFLRCFYLRRVSKG
jgi:hypothetical protein